jgi:hypothetical protein
VILNEATGESLSITVDDTVDDATLN